MGQVTDPSEMLEEIERRLKMRPCTLVGLENLERDFEQQLKVFRGSASERCVSERLTSDLVGDLRRIDGIRLALRQRIADHRNAQIAISRLKRLIARGYVREAVVESLKLRSNISGFSDLSLNFVADAQTRHELRQRQLLIFCGVLTGGIILAAAIIEYFKFLSAQ